MLSPLVYSKTRPAIVISLAAIFFFVLLHSTAMAQEAYLVSAADGSLSAYNLATNTLIESTTAGLSKGNITIGPNPRLAFVTGGSLISVIDLAVQREIQHTYQYYVAAAPVEFSPDGRYMLSFDTDATDPSDPTVLDVFDAASMRLLHRVSLAAALGSAAFNYPAGTMVVVGHKVYITPQLTDQSTPTMAVVDLNTFQAAAISIPAGQFDAEALPGYPPNAAATPDGQYVVMGETETSDFSYHLLFINTAVDALAVDNTITYDPYGIAISPSTSSSYGYLLALDPQGDFSAVVIDLTSGSPTFGQLLPQTEVDLSAFWLYESGVAINASGSRLVVSGFRSSQSPQPNVVVIDTAQMRSHPDQAIVATPTVANGVQATGLTIASISTTMPPLAPVVHSVSGHTVNNTANTLHIFGDNFQPGAMVRIGAMLPIAATVNSPRDLEITLPANVPAGPHQDVLVTNPNVSAPPSRQYLSGVLPGAVDVQLNPAFSTRYQFAAINAQSGSVSLYDSSQRAMVNVVLPSPATNPASAAFNASGTSLYSAGRGPWYAPRQPYVLGLNVGTDAETPILAPGNRGGQWKTLDAAVNPATGKSVVYEWTGFQDVTVNMVDTDPSSPTFNTVIQSLPGNRGSDLYFPFSGAATPDGKYVYVNEEDIETGTSTIDIFDIVHGGSAVVLSAETLGVADEQFNMYVSPDGKSLLMLYYAPNGDGQIKVFDIGSNPLSPTLVTTIAGNSLPYDGLLYSYVIVGNRLFAYEYINSNSANVVWIYNFDRQHNNYSVLGYALEQGSTYANKVITVSPDGNFLFIPGDEAISVYNVSQIVNGQAPLLTQLASYHGPAVLTVSPAAGQNLIRPYAGAPRHKIPSKPQVDEAGNEPLPPEVERRLEKAGSNRRNPRLTLEP